VDRNESDEMIGCDVTRISRFNEKTEFFINRILSLDEMTEYNTRSNKVEYLASRWSAKESVFKATGIKNATILNNKDGSPYVLNYPDIHVTISHDGDYAFTVALDKRNG
jgi:holo-[acyl-carrier protein] synthase